MIGGKHFRKYTLKKENMNKILVQKGINKSELSDLLGVTYNHFLKKMAGTIMCTYEEVKDIAEYLDVKNYAEIALFSPQIRESDFQKVSKLYKTNCRFNSSYFNECLEEEDISAPIFCKLIGFSYSSLNKWTNNVYLPRSETLIAFSKYFDKPISSFLMEDTNKLEDEQKAEEKEPLHNTEEVMNPDKGEISENCNSLCEYKTFEEGNVLGNMKIINDNIVLLASEFLKDKQKAIDFAFNMKNSISSILEAMKDLEEKFADISDRLSSAENKLDMQIPKATIRTSTILPPVLSDNEVISVCKTSIKTDDFLTYKSKVQKLISYIGKKKNLVYNQIAHDLYKQFESVYGMSLTLMRKDYTKETNVLNVIYDEPVAREVFFNMIATEASHYAGDKIEVN